MSRTPNACPGLLNRRSFVQGAALAATAIGARRSLAQGSRSSDLLKFCIDGHLMVSGSSGSSAPGGGQRSPTASMRSPLQAVVAENHGGPRVETVLRTTSGPNRGLSAPSPNAAREIRQNAPMAPGQRSPSAPSRAAYSSKWDTDVLDVYFFDRDRRKIDQTLETVAEWSRYCNLKFRVANSINNAHVRVGFQPGGGNWSLVGTSSLRQNLGQQSMNIDFASDQDYNRYVILHEFGHAMGMIHEHQQPNREFEFRSFVYSYFANLGLNKEAVDFNIVKIYNENDLIRFSRYDRKSIMVYAIPRECLLRGEPVEQTYELSDTDIEFAAQMYGPGPEYRKPSQGDHEEGGKGENDERPQPGRSDKVRSLTADGRKMSGELPDANSEASYEFTVPTERDGEYYTLGTEGQTQVKLRLYGPDDRAVQVQPDKGDWGSPDTVNDVIRVRLPAGRYTVKVSHYSPEAAGKFSIYLDPRRNSGYLSHR